jgi:hypothetical protein
LTPFYSDNNKNALDRVACTMNLALPHRKQVAQVHVTITRKSYSILRKIRPKVNMQNACAVFTKIQGSIFLSYHPLNKLIFKPRRDGKITRVLQEVIRLTNDRLQQAPPPVHLYQEEKDARSEPR